MVSRKSLLLSACGLAGAGLAAAAAMHAWAPERCEWLGEARSVPPFLGAAAMAVGLFMVLIAADTTFNLGPRFGGWLLEHPARPSATTPCPCHPPK